MNDQISNCFKAVNAEIDKFETPMKLGDQQTFLFNDGVIVVEKTLDENNKALTRVQVLGGEPIRIEMNIGI